VAWIASVPTAIADLVTGRTCCSDDLLGQPLTMSDGRTYVPFRHTRRGPSVDPGASDRSAVLQPRFHLALLPARRRWLHALFRVVCIVTTPFFVGLPGFRSKLWMVDPATGDFAGLYEWDDAAGALAYAEGLAAVLRVLSTRGTVTYEVVPDMTVPAYLAAHARPEPDRPLGLPGAGP
jgi:hypothetical protein